ncbi:hypothetical protein GGR50DRAFT_222310 [Xylaria sp. CBS 124048]|nr:hypothetical protein GGR50DRAFT_222310 [Xylaria sp. CBS 124048]
MFLVLVMVLNNAISLTFACGYHRTGTARGVPIAGTHNFLLVQVYSLVIRLSSNTSMRTQLENIGNIHDNNPMGNMIPLNFGSMGLPHSEIDISGRAAGTEVMIGEVRPGTGRLRHDLELLLV